MGAVLEMTQRAGFRMMAGLALALGLAGCSSDTSGNLVSAGLARLKSAGAEPQDLRAAITPASVAETGRPLILVELPDREDAQALAFPLASNGATDTWVSTDGVSLGLRRGILTATRGLGGDLISADLDDVVPGVFGQTSRATRIHRYLDGEDQIVVRAFICDYSQLGRETVSTAVGQFSATHVEESCAGPEEVIENQYWIGMDGDLRKSLQWAGPGIGYMLIERLSD